MNANEKDEVFAALARLPERTQHAAARSATLTLALRALAANRAHGFAGIDAADIDVDRGRVPHSRQSLVARWLARERFVPAVLCFAGALYTHGAVRKLVSVFAAAPASIVRAARETESRAPLQRAVVWPLLQRENGVLRQQDRTNWLASPVRTRARNG